MTFTVEKMTRRDERAVYTGPVIALVGRLCNRPPHEHCRHDAYWVIDCDRHAYMLRLINAVAREDMAN